MNLPPLPLIDGCLFVDNSHWMDPLQTCDRLLEYQSLHQRISAGESSALNFGTAQHLAREFRYKVYKDADLNEAYHNSISSILADFYAEHPNPTEDYRNLNWALEVSRHYDLKWPKERFKLMQWTEPKDCDHCNKEDSKYPKEGHPCPFCSGTGKNDMMVELSFALPLYQHKMDDALWQRIEPQQRLNKGLLDNLPYIPVFYSGRIDLPIILDNQIWVLDFKTTSVLGEVFWNRMRMSSQQRGYCWAFQQLTGKKVAGYIVRAIRTKEPPLYVTQGGANRKGKSQSPEQWWDESLAENREYVNDDKLAEWKQNTIELMEKFFWQYSRDYMPMSTESCTKFNRCQYFDVCTTVRNERGVVLSSGLYKDNLWTPLKKVKQ